TPGHSRRVFLFSRAPHRGFSHPSTVSTIVARGLARAGLAPATHGAHPCAATSLSFAGTLRCVAQSRQMLALGLEAVAMVKTSHERNCSDASPGCWSWRREMPGTIRWLHPKTPMRPPMIVGEIGAERLLGVSLVADDDVVHAVSTESADHSFRER